MMIVDLTLTWASILTIVKEEIKMIISITVDTEEKTITAGIKDDPNKCEYIWQNVDLDSAKFYEIIDFLEEY